MGKKGRKSLRGGNDSDEEGGGERKREDVILGNIPYVDTRKFVIVFDIDYTLWPFWVDTHVIPPFKFKERRVGKGKTATEQIIVDACGREIDLYRDVRGILEALKARGFQVGVVSRTEAPHLARRLIEMLKIEQYLGMCVFDTGTKVHSIRRILDYYNLRNPENDLRDCILFDDEYRNIADVNRVKGTAVLIDEDYGLTRQVFETNLLKFITDRGYCGGTKVEKEEEEEEEE